MINGTTSIIKKYKSKSKRKSGIYDKPSDEVAKKQLWPQSKLQYEYAGSKMSFEDFEQRCFYFTKVMCPIGQAVFNLSDYVCI
jgi:hypothetical protein